MSRRATRARGRLAVAIVLRSARSAPLAGPLVAQAPDQPRACDLFPPSTWETFKI
jgi:hypothetical protein